MLRLCHCRKMKGYHLGATDGEVGKVEDFYFDDHTWTVRYLIADTGYWLPDRLVLISPHALKQILESERVLQVDLTRQQIENSPPITTDQPVSRQFEEDYFRYYGWPVYWTGPALWGPGVYPISSGPALEAAPMAAQPPGSRGDPHLRSVHVDDVVVEERSWIIRYLSVDTGKWLPGRKVLIAPQWIQSVSWQESAVTVDLLRNTIRQAPAYDPDSVVSRDYEISLFKHYSREGYWQPRDGERG
jgi:hypothetical protein